MKMELGSCKEEREDQERITAVAATMEDRDGRKSLDLGFGVGGDIINPSAGVPDGDDLMLDINGDDLLFTDDVFPSLPDFPVLGSPSPSMSGAAALARGGGGGGGRYFSSASTSSSSSSSAASWPFLQPNGDGDMPGQPEDLAEAEVPVVDGDFMMLVDPSSSPAEGEFPEAALDILNLLDMSPEAGPWDPCSVFPSMDISPVAVDETAAGQENPPPPASDNGARSTEEEEEPTDQELSKIFLDWLRNNRDSISPEDLRSIKLKCSTIDFAARRLGGGKQAKMQLVKLILTWVQNNHLQKKRRRSRYHSSAAYQPPVALPYHHHQPRSQQVSLSSPSWMPYPFDISTGGAPLSGMMAAAAYTVGGTAAPNYCYSYNGSSSSNMVVDGGQPFSPPTEFHPVDPTTGAWPPQFATAPAQFAPFPCASAPLGMAAPPPYGVLPNQFSGHPTMYPPKPENFSATKEARKKRMARQRRFKNVHRLPAFAPGSGFSNLSSMSTNSVKGCGSISAAASAIYSNLPNSSRNQMNPLIEQSTEQKAATAPLPPPAPEKKTQQKGLKTEKNLKFLMQKVLKQSDVGLDRIVLPKKEAEKHLPELNSKDGIDIQMEDIGTNQAWDMRYRYWPSNRSRMYLLENTGDFVRSNGLQEGDFIVLYLNVKCSKYMIRGVKVRTPESRAPRTAGSCKNLGGKAHSKVGVGNAKEEEEVNDDDNGDEEENMV